MKNNYIHVCFIIDESSSMLSSVEDVKEGFKKIIKEQKANKEGTCSVSVFRFATTVHPSDFIMKDVKEIEENLKYRPSGCTAMYDGIGTAIDEIGKVLNDMPENERPEKNLIVIMTDGEENSSREYQPSKVKEMIKHQEDKYSWTFLYIGTDISNTEDADRVGVNYKFANIRSKLGKAYDTVNTVLQCYRNTVGDATLKAATMDSYLTTSVANMNKEYKNDTGIDIK